MTARLFVALQFLLPRHLLTAWVHRITRIRQRHVKNALIRGFVRWFSVNTEELARHTPLDFTSLNDFFTRELKANVRPVDSDVDSVCSPVDGRVSAVGYLDGHAILQAKGLRYSLEEFLTSDLDDIRSFVDGAFATLYLAPFNYHRVHAPLGGELLAARYVPGDLFSVSQSTVKRIPGLFRRNERLVLKLATSCGPVIIVFVGALNVGSISTPWTGEIRPRKKGVVENLDLRGHSTAIDKGELLGWFNMGSTVVLLMPPGAVRWDDALAEGAGVVMGRPIGSIVQPM